MVVPAPHATFRSVTSGNNFLQNTESYEQERGTPPPPPLPPSPPPPISKKQKTDRIPRHEMSTPPTTSASPPAKRQKAASGQRTGHRSAYRSDPTRQGLPQKKHYRQRAHANPFSDHQLVYPPCPQEMDWSNHFSPSSPTTSTSEERKVEVADIGCGFGGLIISLPKVLPGVRMLGMEIRTQVTEYVDERIRALRRLQGGEVYGDVGVIRANAMKFLPNFFERSQLQKVFLCFPDPHFKARKHKARIVSCVPLSAPMVGGCVVADVCLGLRWRANMPMYSRLLVSCIPLPTWRICTIGWRSILMSIRCSRG